MADKRSNNFYARWQKIILRCYKESNPNYFRYGGRGIKVSDDWMVYKNFKRDMYPSFVDGLWIDRINNNGDYSKDNCRWSTVREQSNNRRNTRFITYNGVRKTLSYWAEEFGIKFSTLRQRYYVYKWDLDKCFNKGVNLG